ncbi:hypothetical protein, partial [Croceitalea vernalis]
FRAVDKLKNNANVIPKTECVLRFFIKGALNNKNTRFVTQRFSFSILRQIDRQTTPEYAFRDSILPVFSYKRELNNRRKFTSYLEA